MSWSSFWHKHKADLLCEVVSFPEPLFKENSSSTVSPTSGLFLHQEDSLFWNGLFSSEMTVQAIIEIFELLNIYADTHKQCGEYSLLEECKWHFPGCYCKLCLSCLCWKSTVLLGSRTYLGSKEEHLSRFSHSCGLEKNQTRIYIYIYLVLLAVEAECKAHKITIFEKHGLLINTKYYVRCTFA